MKKYIAVCMITALTILAGCGTNRVVVKERPPDPVYYRPPSPNPSFVWVGHKYVKKDGKYEYSSGYWISPKKKSHRWYDGRWKQTKRGWTWVDGHWGS